MLTDTGSRRLLFVDDDIALGHAFAKLARGWGYLVDVAVSGARALELASRGSYGVVLTETTLPDTDGVRLVEEDCTGTTGHGLHPHHASFGSQCT